MSDSLCVSDCRCSPNQPCEESTQGKIWVSCAGSLPAAKLQHVAVTLARCSVAWLCVIAGIKYMPRDEWKPQESRITARRRSRCHAFSSGPQHSRIGTSVQGLEGFTYIACIFLLEQNTIDGSYPYTTFRAVPVVIGSTTRAVLIATPPTRFPRQKAVPNQIYKSGANIVRPIPGETLRSLGAWMIALLRDGSKGLCCRVAVRE